MARIITINYYYSIVNFPYVDLQKFSRPFGPVIYDVTQSTDQIQKNDRTTSSLKVLISDTIPLKRTDFPKSRDKFLQALVNYDEFFKVIVLNSQNPKPKTYPRTTNANSFVKHKNVYPRNI